MSETLKGFIERLTQFTFAEQHIFCKQLSPLRCLQG
jgi:hypothetical protein